MTRRYAEDTKVSVDTTRGQIERMLKSTKANRVMTMDEPLELIVAFVLDQRWIKIEVTVKGDASAQERRAKWRALHMIVKAKLEAIAQKITTAEQEFLAHVVLPDGQTVGAWIRPQIERAIERGEQPKLLPDYSGRSG